MKKININSEYINLIQFLKLTNYISSGGEVTFFMNENNIKIDDIEPFEKRKKIYSGQIIQINNDSYQVLNNEIN